jgi:hypothetical protein
MTPAPFTERVTPDNGDPLDLQRHRLGVAPAAGGRVVPWHIRFGLNWSSGSPPVILLLLLGAALGPGALSILTPAVLTAIDPALPVALAVLGVHMALGMPMARSAHDDALLVRASIQGAVTGGLVIGGMLLLQTGDAGVLTFHAWVIALAAGVCASTSARLPSDSVATAQTAAMRLQQLDAVLPLAAGGLLLAWVREGSMLPAATLALQSMGLALVIAVAGWLLLTRTSSDNEGRILGTAVLLLVGGLADYLSLSALLSGLVAGVFWRVAPGHAGEWLRRDVRHVLHPLLVLMLVVAGARVEVTTTLLILAFGYVLLRTLGKLFGGWLVRRLRRPALPEDLGLMLLSPGIIGIAFAVNTVRSAGPQADPLLGLVVFGTIGSQIIAACRRTRELDG